LKLCIPVSDVFRSQENQLLPLVDAVSFKKPSPVKYGSKAHFLETSFNIGSADFSRQMEESRTLQALMSGKYESFACDIGPNCQTVRAYSSNGYPRALPHSEPLSDEVYLERVVENVQWLRQRYSGYIQVENLNYFPTGAYERVCEPVFVKKLIEKSGVGLLLDIGHAVVSAHYLGYSDLFSYLRQLPLHRVREVQLSRAGFRKDVFEDLHDAPGEDEWSLVQRIVGEGSDISYLTIEYYRNADKLCEVYNFIHQALEAQKRGIS
jgi:uncharacterized protein